MRGIATDKAPRHRFAQEAFALPFARLLGLAAAPNLIVGRRDIAGKVLFDDGDEILVEDEKGLPLKIVVADQTGTFVDYEKPLEASAPAYAGPVNRRMEFLPNPEAFVKAYLDAFVERFTCIQHKFRTRKRAFQTLFANRPYDERGSFAHRWSQVLRRLDGADPHELAELIRASLLTAVRS